MSEITQSMHDSSRSGTVLGIATIVFGVLAMFMPMVSGLTAITVVGVLLIAGGIVRTIFALGVVGENLTDAVEEEVG